MSYRIDGAAAGAALRKTNESFTDVVRRALDQASSLATQFARTTPKFKDRTGSLRNSISRVQKGAGGWRYDVKAGGRGAQHALFVEAGTRAHVIEARRRQFLRFEVAGTIHFRRWVNHPGTKGTHFMFAARNEGEEALNRFVQAGVSRTFR